MVISEKEKRTTAYHEAGHALVALKLPGTDPLHKVSIIPRGRALGVTMQLPEDEKHTYPVEPKLFFQVSLDVRLLFRKPFHIRSLPGL